jgi:hypothetical protein
MVWRDELGTPRKVQHLRVQSDVYDRTQMGGHGKRTRYTCKNLAGVNRRDTFQVAQTSRPQVCSQVVARQGPRMARDFQGEHLIRVTRVCSSLSLPNGVFPGYIPVRSSETRMEKRAAGVSSIRVYLSTKLLVQRTTLWYIAHDRCLYDT